MAAAPVRAQDADIRVGLTGGYLSNAYLDGSEQPDAIMTPEGSFVLYLDEAWSAGYRGRMDWYGDTDALSSHGHDAFLAVGSRSTTEEGLLRRLWARVAVQTLFNATELEDLDHVTPAFTLGGTYDVSDWLSLAPDLELEYRHFLQDADESQLNAGTCAELGAHLPSRTTLLARPCYGFRYYFADAAFLENAPAAADTVASGRDAHQLELRVRLAQALTDSLGLRLEYQGRHVLQRAERAETAEAIGILRADLSSDFRYDRHRPSVRLSWLPTDRLLMVAEGSYERRDYEDIDAWVFDGSGGIVRSQEDRADDRWAVMGTLEYRWRASDSVRLTGSLEYDYLDIHSTSEVYDSAAHQLLLGFRAEWSVGAD